MKATMADETTNKSDKSEAALREEEMLAFWEREGIFQQSLKKDSPKGDFIFYDGPPFATGLPHYGHILASTIKDAVPRYKTMQGYHVPRKWGWDCHGLPLENIIEKRLGLATKRDIEALGVEKFNEAARDAVLEYADDWKKIIPRMGRWADMDDDYRTMDATYTESVWWAFKTLDEKGLVYEGFKSMHLCPRCGTTLSNFEVNLGYKDIKDIAVTVKLELKDEPGTYLLVWTTTPWTLPGNMAAAVHKDYEYVKVRIKKEDGTEEKVILAKDRLSIIESEYEIEETFSGKKLVGRSYIPPFDYFAARDFEHKANAWMIYHADYVELGEEGTGAVHLAPAYGDEDMALAKVENIPIVHHVDHDGHFREFVTDFAGQLVKPKDDEKNGVLHLDADIAITKYLQEKGLIFKKENIKHSYPHCWRCDTPLLNYATTSWFVRATELKDQLVAENNNVRWVPEHVGRARFGDWLENVRDWAISRQRYWGAPLPVWRNPDTQEYRILGSLEELQLYVKRSGNTYFVMRHGESVSNEHGVVSARHDNDSDVLTERGRTQVADALAHIPEDIDLIIHSGFIRTKETAEIIAEARGLSADAIIEDTRIGEVSIAAKFEGKTWAEYNAQFPQFADRYTMKIDGVENRRDVQVRTGEFLYDLEEQYRGKKILIISHAGTIFGLSCAAVGADVDRAHTLWKDGDYMANAEVQPLHFVPMPHNRNFELDYHRPYIDEIELYDESGTKLVRVPDVFDCWFESGSMPYGQQHYPFENLDVFSPDDAKGYPADFIAEGLDQTRGWFYSLIVLGTALFGRSPYKNVIVNGLVLAEDGKKMSKSLQNYPDPMLVADKYGVDTMRFYLLSSSIIKGEDLNFSEKGLAELARKNIGRLHNVLAFYELYRDAACAPTDASPVAIDRWIRARLAEVIDAVTNGFDAYELDRATRPITDFIDDLSVWYVRRSRDRFKGDDVQDRTYALGTLRYVLTRLAEVMAPTMPFYADYLYRAVRTEGDPESVHLASWPEAPIADMDILRDMADVRTIVSLALDARTKANIKVRQPLARLSVKDAERIVSDSELNALIRDEVNVKEVVAVSAGSDRVVLDTEVTDALRIEGVARDFMREVQEARKNAGLAPQDRIVVEIKGASPELRQSIDTFSDEIKKTVGADEVVLAEGEAYALEIRKV